MVHFRRPSGLTVSGGSLSSDQQPAGGLQGHGAACFEESRQALGEADEGFRHVHGGRELGVEVAEVADDLATGFDGVPLGAPLVLETEEPIEAGAGEDRGSEERPLAVDEDRPRHVAGGQALAPAEDRPTGAGDWHDDPRAGDIGLGSGQRFVLLVETGEEFGGEGVRRTGGATIFMVSHGINLLAGSGSGEL